MSKKTVILFGPPGCGKGTQATFLSKILHVPVVPAGELLRREMECGSPAGESLSDIVRSGALVPDDLVNGIVSRQLSGPEFHDGFVLDGYPRTVGQAAYLDSLLGRLRLPPPEVIVIEVPAAPLIERLTARQQCPSCGRSYNDRHWTPAHRGFCDDDGMALVRRSDDVEPVIRERLRHYEESSRPVLDYYDGRRLHRVDGTAAPGDVLEAIETALALYAKA